MAKKKKVQDTSPLAMGIQQKGSVAYKKEQKAGTKTKSQSSVSNKKTSKPISSGFTVGYRSPKANANNTSRSTSTSRNVSSQDRINQKSYGATRRGVAPTATSRQRTTPATSAEMRKQNAAANNNLKQTQAERSRNEQKQRFNTAKEMMAARRQTNEQAKAQNAKEWEGVKNTSKEEQQAWFTKKAQEAQQRRTGKVEKGTDNLATSAAKSAFHGAKGAVHSLYGALTRASLQVENETQRDKALAALRGEDVNQAESVAREKAKKRQDLKLAGIRAKTKAEQEKVEEIKEAEAAKDKGPIPLRKMAVGAASFTGQRVVDTALLGPYSLASMGARVLEDERNAGQEKNERLKKRLAESGQFTQEELDEEFKRIDRRSVANAYASSGIEVLSELMFGGIGLSKKYMPEGTRGILDKTVGKLFGNIGKTAAGRLGLGIAEETAEEWIANPVQARVSNMLTGNRLQSLQEESVRREYQKQAMDLKEMQATSADINSDAFLERAKEIYKESGATDKEASKIAELARDYFNADIIGDSDTAEAKLSEITNILAGGENDLREKWTLKDALEVAGEMILSVGAEGFAGAISSSAAGNAYKTNYGVEGVRKLAKVVENLDADKSDRAKAIIDDIDSGKDITGTQVSQIMEWSNETALKAQDREITRDNLVQNRMKDEKLFVPIVDSEYNLSPATDARFEEISDRVADNIDNMGIKMSDVDAYAIADVVAAYETGTISAEQMNELNVENPEARAVFERETGINLDQYTVKDKRGNIKVAESNIKMQKALFSNAADNYMASARIEQENWNNVERGRAAESLTSDMDGMGGVGIQRVLESVDPRNRGDFMLAGSVARRVYDHARLTNDSWEDVRKDFKNAFPGASMDESMRYVYDMAKRTKAIAETQYYGKQVSNKQSLADSETMYVPGNFTNNSERMLGNTELSTLTNMATTLGVNIVMSDNMANKNANGSYDSSTRTITLNADKSMGEMLQFVLAHEVTHHLAAYAPDEYLKLSRFVMDKAYKADAEKFEAAIKNIQKKYKDQAKQDLTPEQALEEIIADNAHEFWQDEAFINDVTSEEPTLAQSIINAIKDILNKLRRVLASGNITDENDRQFLFDEIDSYDQTYKLWMNAFRVARDSQANQAINDWQDAVNAGSVVRYSENNGKTFNPFDGVNDYKLKESALLGKYNIIRVNDYIHVQKNIVKNLDDSFFDDYTVESTGMVVNIGRKGIKETFGKGKLFEKLPRWLKIAKIATVEELPTLIANARPIAEGVENYHEGKTTTYDYLEADTEIFGVPCTVRLDIKKSEEKNKFHLHRVIIKNEQRLNLPHQEDKGITKSSARKLSLPPSTTERNSLSEEAYSKADKAMPKSILREGQAVNNGENEEGRLVEMFHGSGTPNFTEFELQGGMLGNGAYFTSAFPEAVDYAKEKLGITETKDGEWLWDGETYSNDELEEALEDGGYVRPFYLNVTDQNDVTPSKYGNGDVIAVIRNKGDAKSSEPITVDDNGDVIPIERRYDLDNPDVRYSIGSESDIINTLKENFDEYKEDEANLRIATEALDDLQRVRFALSESSGRDVSGRWDGGVQVRTIGKGITTSLLNEGRVDFRGQTVETPEDLAKLCQVLRDPRFETFRVVLTKGDKIVSFRSISSRLPGVSAAFELDDIRESIDLIKNRMDRLGADGYYLIHNHPSGDVNASYEDLNVTRAYLALLGQNTYKGHIILDHDEYGYIDADIPQQIHGDNFPTPRIETITGQQTIDFIHEPEIDHPVLGSQIKDSGDVAKVAQTINSEGDVSVLIYTSSKASVRGVQEISNKALRNNKEIGGYIRNQAIDEFGSPAVFLYTTDLDTYNASKKLIESGHLVDSVIGYGAKNGATESGRANVAEPGKIGQLGLTDEQYKRGKVVFESAAGADNYSSLKYSITPKMDADYMAAVESNNMEEAQRLVDEAAKAAGMRVAHRFHGTLNYGFTKFDKAKANVGGNSGAGFYFSTNEDDSSGHYSNIEGADNDAKIRAFADHLMEFEEEWKGIAIDSDETALEVARKEIANNPGIYDVYLNYANPYVRNFKNSTNIYDDIIDSFDESVIDREDYDSDDAYEEDRWMYMDEHFYETIDTAVRRAYDQLEESYEVLDGAFVGDLVDAVTAKAVEGSLTWDDIADVIFQSADITLMRDEWYESEYGATEMTRAIVEAFGYDAIEDKEVDSKFGQLSREMMTGTEHIIVFKPEQIKLSDPVTYAEDGSVIPLSERFNPENDDIRYSLPTQDADGKILSDGQMEYFKNSMARDREGKLVPVFHSTSNGGFSIFDPSYSDDKRSIFFTSNRQMSKSYIRGYGKDFEATTFGLPAIEWDDIENLSDVAHYFRKLKEAPGEKQDLLGIRIRVPGTINEDGFAESYASWGEESWSYDDTLNDLINKYGEDYKNIEGEFIDEDGAIIGEFSDWHDLVNEFLDCVKYVNDQIGTEGKGQTGTYQCYLNLENPMIIDCKGRNWDSILGDGFEELFISYDGESFYVDGTTIPWTLDEIRDQYGDGFADAAEEWIETAPEDDLEMGDKVYTWDGAAFNPEVEGYWPSEENTRYWCLEAEAQGYDGVIFLNLMDNGPHGYGTEIGDVYVAFSSNQIKDIYNLNPTENPDIRYSISDEDEAKSRMAYEDAIDNSFEALEYYEQRLADLTDETAENRPIKKFNEDRIAEFYAGLKADDSVPYSDYVLEEDRVRMAQSKNDYFNNINAKWNDRWTTDGEVLNVKSVKTDVQNLIMGVMSNSDTDSQYKRELVNKTLFDIRTAYQLMKQDRPEVASALLYHSAQRMIDNVEFYVDGTFDQYKELRDYLRNTRISIGEEYWADVEYDAFRKRNFGRLKLVKGRTNVDQIYQELEEKFREWFNEEEAMDVPSQLLQIEHVLDSVQPYKEAYSSEAAAELAFDIADDLYEIMVNGDEVRSLADTYKARYDEKTKAMKQRHAEAVLRMRKARDEGILQERAKWRARDEARKERQDHSKHFSNIQKNYNWLKERLLTNTKDKHIPEQYKKELAGLLAAFDLQTVGSKKLEAKRGYQAQKTIQMSAIRTGLNAMHEAYPTFYIHDSITDKIDALAKEVNGKTIDELTVTQLQEIDDILKGLKSDFINYDRVMVKGKKMAAADAGKAEIKTALDHVEEFGAAKDYQNLPGVIDKLINLDEMTAPYLFRRIDPDNTGLGMMYGEIRRGFDKYVRNQAKLNDWMEEIVGKYHQKGILWNKYGSGELSDWRSDTHAKTFNFEGGPLRLTPAQMMSLYCLSKRPQAMNHILQGGVVAAPVSFNAKMLSDIKGKVNKAVPTYLTGDDIKQIVAELTPEQIQVATQLQELMSTKMAEWGNEASMDVMDIELFKEKEYFPIKSDQATLTKDLNDSEFVQAVRNFGFTKALTPNAGNTIVIDDIFDVVAEHCNNMNLYNAYSKAFDDFMKVYNYKDYGEDGTGYTVQQAVAHAYSQKATTFIMTLLRDLNGNVSGRASGVEDAYNTMLGNAKKAAVFANFRVAAQQPTAITRAFYVIDPKYLKGVKIEKGAMVEMFEHCPIALWKSWGYYDINMGKSIEDIMMNNGRWLEDKATDLYGALDNVTWTAIWQMVKNEMKDTHPDVEIGTDEYWDLCNERMSEVVDLTQVVDSPLHRSHGMRSKNFLVKTATAFMAEPTLTFNMLRDGYIRSAEARRRGKILLAGQIASRVIAVGLLQAVTVAGASGLVDALRGKNPDKDDDDERFLHLWWVNFIENFKDELKIWNKIYVVKDIASQLEGWDNANLALQGLQKFSLGWRQIKGDPYARSSASWYENMADGLGYMFGVPVKTMRTGIKNAMDFFGIEMPEGAASYFEHLDDIAKDNKKKKQSESKGEATSVINVSSVSHWYDYENNPITVKDGSTFDRLLNHFGINLTKAEKAAVLRSQEQKEFEQKREEIKESVLDYTGEEKAKKTWSKVTTYLKEKEGKSVNELVESGDFATLAKYRTMFLAAGNSEDYFDSRIYDASKKALKKSIVYDATDSQINAQENIKDYLLSHGMTEAEMSDIAYRSDTARDMKVAFRLGDKELMMESLEPLVNAGLTYEDLERLWKNRNRVDLKKYDGRYKDKLKSTGNYVFPVDGIITSDFGHRSSPGGIGSTNHQGIDIGASQGTPVAAADGGVVVMAGWYGGYGKTVQVKHDDGTITQYSHLSWWDVKEGDVVGQGQEVGLVGSTGNSTGPHLHFGVLKNGEYVDPKSYINTADKQWDTSA